MSSKQYAHLTEQWESIELYVNAGNEQLEKLNEFIKKQAEIELEYARSSYKLIKSYKDDIQRRINDKSPSHSKFSQQFFSSSLMQAWKGILDRLEASAKCHANVAERLDKEIRKPFKYQGKESDRKNRLSFDEIRKARSEWKRALEVLDKNRARYEKAVEEAETAQNVFQAALIEVSRKDTEKLKLATEKKRDVANEALSTYKTCITETNAKKRFLFEEVIPGAIQRILEEDQKERVIFSKTNLTQYAKVLAKEQDQISASYASMAAAISSIIPEADENTFFESLGTSDIPDDFELDMKDFKVKPAKSTELNSNDQSAENAIISLPPDEGIPKAVERKQKLERELAEIDRKTTHMLALVSATDSAAALFDVKELTAILTEKGNSMRKKISILSDYINANTEGGLKASSENSLAVSLAASSIPGLESNFNIETLGNYKLSTSNKAFDSSKGSIAPINESPAYRVPKKVQMVQALYDFSGNPANGEMSMTAGDEFELLVREPDGWWHVRSSDGREGYVPGNYTDELASE